jgi:hypothetical protein
MSEYNVHTCIRCRKRGDKDLIRWGFKNYTHLECGLEKWGQAFLNQLTVEQLQSIPKDSLLKHGLYQSWRALLTRKEEYGNRERRDLTAGRKSVRVV